MWCFYSTFSKNWVLFVLKVLTLATTLNIVTNQWSVACVLNAGCYHL